MNLAAKGRSYADSGFVEIASIENPSWQFQSQDENVLKKWYEIFNQLAAPEIAERLVDRAELEHVWEVVRRCVFAIRSGRNEDAKSMYMHMVLSLERKYSGNLPKNASM